MVTRGRRFTALKGGFALAVTSSGAVSNLTSVC